MMLKGKVEWVGGGTRSRRKGRWHAPAKELAELFRFEGRTHDDNFERAQFLRRLLFTLTLVAIPIDIGRAIACS